MLLVPAVDGGQAYHVFARSVLQLFRGRNGGGELLSRFGHFQTQLFELVRTTRHAAFDLRQRIGVGRADAQGMVVPYLEAHARGAQKPTLAVADETCRHLGRVLVPRVQVAIRGRKWLRFGWIVRRQFGSFDA